MPKTIKIYGERNTNTNYLSELIKLNLDAQELPGVVPYRIEKLQQILPCNELIKDIYFKYTFKKNLGWKHSKVIDPKTLKRLPIVSPDLALITITKNPYSWLLSLYQRPYHQHYSNKPSFVEFLSSPWKTVNRENCPAILSNPIILWNIKNKSYLPLETLNGINITTEEILTNPEIIIKKISEKFSIKKITDEFINYTNSTKDNTKDFAYYKDYYTNERWRDKLPDEAIEIINNSIDKPLVKHFGYQLL